MLTLGPLAFAAPWLLLALASLPLLWWLLRAVPPSPRLVPFPAIRLLFGLDPTQETPHRTPWWLLLLRLILAALVILALARPLLNPTGDLRGSGPLLLVVDDGWAAAKNWPARQTAMADLIDSADRTGKPVIILTTAPRATGEPLAASRLMRPGEARRLIPGLAPKPWPVDRAAAQIALAAADIAGSANIVWLSDGIDDGNARQFAEQLQQLGATRVLIDTAADLPVLLLPPEPGGDGLIATALRPDGTNAQSLTINASTEDGRQLGQEILQFAAGETAATVEISLPTELRNRVTRLAIPSQSTAASVVLVDERFRRRPVGLASSDTPDVDQPLLGDLYYLDRALGPFAEVRRGNIETLLSRDLAVLILADIGTLTGADGDALAQWIDRGGVLVRFAGPRLAERNDDLLPVALRRGGRSFGGIMSWEKPIGLAPFEAQGPFAGLAIPEDVVVRRQVLAEPAPDLGSKTWARLDDGTPLVTADRRGEGWIVLVHTTANTAWSNLSLSGLYVDMLRRIVVLSQGVVGDDSGAALPPLALLDGFGQLTEPASTATAIPAGAYAQATVGPRTPPGFYGTDTARRALNLGDNIDALAPLADLPAGVVTATYGATNQNDLKPWLLLAALTLLLADFLIGLGLRGLLPLPRARHVATGALAALLLFSQPPPAQSQTQSLDDRAIAATRETRLAYVITGNDNADEVSRSGLVGLSLALRARTSVEPGAPIAVNIETDELAFFPLLYWPMSAGQAPLTDNARQRLNGFLRNGGTILFDTRDQQYAGLSGVGPGTNALRQLVGGLDLPPLVPVPPDHVLTKAFYLLQDFPGRWSGGTLWVQQPDSRVNDGVSPVVIGGNDFAAAWASDEFGRPLYPVVPGGERQREIALRFGINLVMYALTGNYKADQVHIPAILERLGQ